MNLVRDDFEIYVRKNYDYPIHRSDNPGLNTLSYVDLRVAHLWSTYIAGAFVVATWLEKEIAKYE